MELENIVGYVTQLVIEEIQKMQNAEKLIPIGISARHVHLSKEHVEALFGKGHQLTVFKALSQPGQFAAEETVEVIGPKGSIKKVRVLGPERPETQIEIAASDSRGLGVVPPVRNSGDIMGTPGVTLKGPYGSVQIEKGVMIAERHVHMNTSQAAQFGLSNNDEIRIFIDGKKGGVLENITVRVSDAYALDLHIDTDDSNAFGIKQGQKVRFEKVERP